MNTRAIVIAALLVAAPAVGLCTDMLDPVARLQALHNEWRDAAASTRLSLLEDLRDTLDGATVRFQGTVLNVSNFALGGLGDTTYVRQITALSWEYHGLRLEPLCCTGQSASECGALAAQRLQSHLPNGDTAHMVIVKDGVFLLYALTQNRSLIDAARRGEEIAVTARVCGLYGDTLFGLLIKLEQVTPPAQSD